jgi:hypothetical protein
MKKTILTMSLDTEQPIRKDNNILLYLLST